MNAERHRNQRQITAVVVEDGRGSKSMCGRSVAIAIGLLCQMAAAVAGEPRRAVEPLPDHQNVIEQIVRSQYAAVERLASLDMTWTWRFERQQAEGQAHPVPRQMLHSARLRMSGDMFRIEAVSEVEGISRRTVWTYTGERYQSFYPARGELVVSDRPPPAGPYQANVPIDQPYGFMLSRLPQPDRRFAALRSAERWNEVFRDAVIIGEDGIQGHACVVVEFPRVPGVAPRQEVAFARDLDFFPFRSRSFHPSGEMASESLVSEIKTLATQQGLIVIPLRVEGAGFSRDDGGVVVRQDWTVDQQRLVINRAIAEETFSVRRELATSFEDVDDPGRNFRPERQPTVAVGEPAPAIDLPTVDGNRFRLVEHRGKIVILEFWATWCGACHLVAPTLEALARGYEQDDVLMVGVNRGEDAETIRAFVAERGYTRLMALDEDESVAERYGVKGIPTALVVGRDGKVRAVRVGYPAINAKLRNDLDSLLVTDAGPEGN